VRPLRVDIGKYFHVGMIHNALGEIVTPTFEIDIFQSGFTALCAAIDEASARCRAKVVLTGLEPTGHYFENLARHLRARPQPVTLVNSYAVKQNRSQQMMRREKTDEIDVASVGDLLRRGEGTLYRPASGPYLQLQQLDRTRIAKLKMQTMLKNQILGHLDRIFPGLVLQGEEALDRVRARPYDLIICDLKMPRLDGTAFYRTLAVTYPALARRIVFVTGDVAGTDAERFLEDSGCRWLAKPFRLKDLLQVARDVVG